MMDKKHCVGCYCNGYNYGLGGAKECCSLKNAKLVKKKKVHIDDVPPWKHRPIRVPDCYHQPKFIFIDANRENLGVGDLI